MKLTAFILGLTAFSLVSADVSHLLKNQHAGHHNSINNHQQQVVKQAYNNNNGFTGSPSEVNSYFSNNNNNNNNIQSSSRFQQAASCTDSNSACVAPRFCYKGIIDQSYENQVPRSAPRSCNAQEVCCRFNQRRNANFQVIALDNEAAPAQSTSEVLTNEGYVVKKPDNRYLPAEVPKIPAANTIDIVTVRPPVAPQVSTRRPIQPTPPRPTPPRTTFAPAPPMIPVGCSAAMNCTRLEFCSAMGVISKTPVVLTPEQQIFRVPITECLHPTTREQGYCCRDPDYVDPWPVGQTGQYVPDELNKVFDSGAYSGGETRVDPVLIKPEQGYVIPQPSNTQNRLYLPPNNRI